jgi:hypothetical protein
MRMNFKWLFVLLTALGLAAFVYFFAVFATLTIGGTFPSNMTGTVEGASEA